MENWFTIEKIDEDTFAISEYGHWEETHCYLLLGTEKAVLIDTGLGVGDIKSAVDSLTKLPVTVITTHVHWDHIGGHKHFNDIAVHEKEVNWIAEKFPIPLQAVKQNLLKERCDFPENFSIDDYRIFQGVPHRVLQDGDCIDLDNRKIKTIHTPGHSPGHCCFYEEDRKYLYSGDLIYSGCLYAFYPTTDPLLFWQSVKKVQALAIERIMPGHHQLNITVGIIDEIEHAFDKLVKQGQLKQGNGIFDFGSFQIHI
ncbi:MAG: MBL fold metallo-hydrolase [Eubacterium sp.]|nr:MBL fold metallo-hydrolase [Eubacterium sp.]